MAKKMTPGRLLPVMHACPECEIGKANPFCRSCHGSGLLTDLQLRIWEQQTNARNAPTD